MWSASEESSSAMEGGPPEAVVHTKETCEQNKNQLESLKEIMMRNQQSLKRKEEEVQEYARRLSKIKSRAKFSRRSKEGASSSKDTTHSHKTESTAKDVTDDAIDDISQAKTPKAKSSLLQRKLAENRKVFEQRNKELTETKRAVEEKVEAIRQQLDETDLAAAEHKDQLAITPIRPLVITSDMMAPIQVQNIQEKEKKIMELNSKIVELEATILDLRENLKEKDSVIDSKTKAVTLMSADLSKKGKTTLDTLEDTKDEMRTMQENFILIEMSLKNKNASLLEQLQERDNRISELEHTIDRFEEQLKEQKIAESASADFSRSTMDTLAETKDAMKSMQENFILVESSLKLKNDNLLQQLEKYEIKLVEAKERIFQLESGVGIVTTPAVEDLQFRIEKLEQNNRQLLDEKYELQKNIAELQDKIIVSKSVHGNDAIIEKDNKIAELENLIEELKQSNKLLEEESKTELQKQVAELSSKSEEQSNKIIDFERQVHELEAEKNDIAARLSAVQMVHKEDMVVKLTKELEDLNKNMIKLKAQHRSKVKNLQKQLENFKMVSDTNAELVRLGNQVALLEEEKGNLQLSLVDFDELKASAGDWQERVADLENKVSSQTKEIQMHIDAIAILENQKLDLTQELHTVKQEILALEAENAESENLRVTAEMKVVELEEQLETAHKEQGENKLQVEHHELLKKLDVLTQENSELYSKLNKMEEKGTSDTGSTESFEAIQINDRNDLLKKIEDLEQKNNELTLKLSKLEEKDGSHAGSTESFETINDTDRSELIKKIEQLTQENSDLTMKLSRIEEKGSSDTGSTESFERIPEHNDSLTKIELLTQENNELVIKLTKLEERLNQIESSAQLDVSKIDHDLRTLKDDSSLRLQIETLTQENNNLMGEISQLKSQIENFTEENNRLQDRIEMLTAENTELVINRTKLEERLQVEVSHSSQMSIQMIQSSDQINALIERQQILEKELAQLRKTSIEHSVNVTSCETDDAKSKLAALEKENAQMTVTIAQLEERINSQAEDLIKITREKEEMELKLEHTSYDDFSKERLELIDKLVEKLNREKENIAHERQELHEQISILLQKSSDEISEIRKAEEAACQESQTVIVTSLEKELENSKVLITEYKNQVEEMNMKLESMEVELQTKTKQLLGYEASGAKLESLECELKDMFVTAEEWKFKYDDMQEKMQALEQAKISIEEAFKTLENGNKELLEVIKEKDAATGTLQENLQNTIGILETRLQDEMANVTAKEHEIAELKTELEKKDQELHTKYAQLQNGLITIDSLQDELSSYSIKLKENEAALSLSLGEIARLNDTIKEKEEEVHSLSDNISKITEVLEQSKPIAEFKEMLENLRNKETSYIELQNKYEEALRENNELSQKIEDMSKHDENIKNELIKREQEIDSLLTAKKALDAQIEEVKSDKTEAEKRIWELQAILDNQTTYAEKVQSELTNEYKQMERLKTKHVEDIAMLNRRLEDVIEELVEKTQENEAMKAELEQKEFSTLLGKNITEETKTILEGKVADLEQKLLESENKLQAQSEKMKKIVATFNKKKVACQELEARVAELEEKWSTEKDEKEVKNKQIQEVEISMREKDNKIHDLEEKLLQAKNNTAEILANSEKFEKESISLKEKITMLMEHVAEMDEEIEKQREEIERISHEVETEKTAKENIAKEYEIYKQTASKEDEQKQAILDEVKEQARELSVRMQVMETEYVEQLATIKNLKAENGLLLSKQTQIDEKLENAEKKSEERRVLIEQLQKEIATMASVAVTTQVPEQSELREDDTRITQHCDHSEQCQNLVQALEARLQERQAEIENLNNELANSYGNIVLLHDESQRYNDMMMQTAQERFNQSLMDQTNTLQQEIDSLKTERAMSDRRILELEAELEGYKHKHTEVGIPITESQQEQRQDDASQLSDSTKIFDTASVSDTDPSVKKEVERLQSSLNEQQDQCSEHMKKMDILLNIEEEKLHVQELQNQFEDSQSKLKQTENLLSEKNAQVDLLNVELDNVIRQLNDLKMLQEEYRTIQVQSQRLRQLVTDETQIDLLITELNTANQKMSSQLQQHADVEAGLRTEISLKDTEITAMRTELTSMEDTVEALTAERDRQIESYKLQINKLETEMRNASDNDLIQEWGQRISATTTERDLLQLQVSDLTRSLDELKESLASQHDLQIELENALREKDQAQILIANLTQALDDSKQNTQESKMHRDSLQEFTSMEKSIVERELEQVPTAVDKPIDEHEQSAQVPVEKEVHEIQLDTGSGWDNGSENLNIDEESWGWNAESAQSVVSSQHLSTMTLSAEMQLRAKVEDLQNRITDLEAQNARIAEENKAAQVKSGKLVKKLKEYKVQIEGLQQQLKTQKQTDSFFDLDTAIEEELKAQIANLEKALNEIKEEKKNVIAEKEALLKRFDVVVSANERYMEMKERQDMEVEVLRIRNNELGNKIQSLEWRLQENETGVGDTTYLQHEEQSNSSSETDKSIAQPQKRVESVESSDNFEVISKKYKEEIDDLKDELEALAVENEQLQHFLEEQKLAMANLESKGNSDEFMERLEFLNHQNAQLQSALNKSKEEYDVLRRQYEQSLIDANDQVTTMRQNSDLLKIEYAEKVERLEMQIDHLQRALEDKKVLEDDTLISSEEKFSAVNVSLMEVTELLNVRVQEVADLKRELQVQYTERQQAEATLQLEIQNLTKELHDRKQDLRTLKQAFSDKEHELIEQRSVETVNTIISEATRELVQKHVIEVEGKDKELRDLTEKLTALQSTVDEYTSKLRDCVTKLEMQQQQIAYLKEDLTERNSIIGITQTDMNLMNEKLREKQQELIQYEEEKTKLAAEVERCLADIQRLQNRLNATEATTVDLQECNSRIHSLEQEVQVLKSEKESILLQYGQETEIYQAQLESNIEQINALKHDLREKTEQLHYVSTQLCAKENDLEGVRAMMSDKDSLLEITSQELNDKRAELERLRNEQNSQVADDLSTSKVGHDDDAELQSTINELKAQMEAKQQELEHLKYVLSENTYPTIIQQMQDRINCLYNEKTTLEASLRATTDSLTERQQQVNLLTQRINEQNQEHISKEEASLLSRDRRRSVHDQEEIVRLQNELHVKQQEINELRYVIAEKDSQLCLQASMEPQSDDFELRETVQRLMGELYGKEQEVQTLKSTLTELQQQILLLKDHERLSEESKSAIERLTSEKEQIRTEAEEFLNRELQKKESEIDEIKQKLSEENRKLLAELQLKDSDIENLKTQFEQLRTTANDRGSKLQQKENELMHTIDDLAEKERRLAELSITKDAELHNLKVQIREKEARIDELLALSAEEEKQLDELRQTLVTSETEVNRLRELLAQKVSEHDLIQHALKKDVSVVEDTPSKISEMTVQTTDNKETVSSELDLALYMLHQRDVRCEELTHELMQLLEERDTLQLRLSNAIRVNEELRRVGSAEASPMKDSSSASRAIIEPVVEQPSPSKSEGPVEIAKEAIDTPIEDKEALALKLSQLHSVSHTKDVRLKDERELRHTQQMSLLAHRDVLNTLPPEAAARFVNANYTLSRDVQSQSSVLLNWLWGKSTPKVVHM